MAQTQDTAIQTKSIDSFYQISKENFRLKKIVQLHFAVLPKQFLNKETVVAGIKKFDEEDKQLLDSYPFSLKITFKRLYLGFFIAIDGRNTSINTG